MAPATMKQQKKWNIVWEQDRWLMSPPTQWHHTWKVRRPGWRPLLLGPLTLPSDLETWPKQASTTQGRTTGSTVSAAMVHWLTGKKETTPGKNTPNIFLTASSSSGTMWATSHSRGLWRKKTAAENNQDLLSRWGLLKRGLLALQETSTLLTERSLQEQASTATVSALF